MSSPWKDAERGQHGASAVLGAPGWLLEGHKLALSSWSQAGTAGSELAGICGCRTRLWGCVEGLAFAQRTALLPWVRAHRTCQDEQKEDTKGLWDQQREREPREMCSCKCSPSTHPFIHKREPASQPACWPRSAPRLRAKELQTVSSRNLLQQPQTPRKDLAIVPT